MTRDFFEFFHLKTLNVGGVSTTSIMETMRRIAEEYSDIVEVNNGQVTLLKEFSDDSQDGDFWENDTNPFKPYEVTNGTLTIPVTGFLVSKMPIQLGSLATGYEYIKEAAIRGQEDPNVSRILYRVNSPGGHAANNKEVADTVAAGRGKGKPIIAIAEDMAASAAYKIASAADKLYSSSPDSGAIGSIGTVIVHSEYSKAAEKYGETNTIIRSGKLKFAGNDLEPLSEAKKARYKQAVDDYAKSFYETVASNRKLTYSEVEDLEGDTFSPKEALEKGLIDGYKTVQSYLNETNYEEQGLEPMAAKEQQVETFTQVDIDAAVKEAVAKAVSETEASTQEKIKQRISTILTCEEAKGKNALASELALSTDVAVEQAKALLKVAAQEVDPEKAKVTPKAFAAQMEESEVEVPGDTDVGDEDELEAGVEGISYAEIAAKINKNRK